MYAENVSGTRFGLQLHSSAFSRRQQPSNGMGGLAAGLAISLTIYARKRLRPSVVQSKEGRCGQNPSTRANGVLFGPKGGRGSRGSESVHEIKNAARLHTSARVFRTGSDRATQGGLTTTNACLHAQVAEYAGFFFCVSH